MFNPGSTNLILQDHPEKGTSVRDLVERVAKDCNELRSLIGQCEAHRKVGETVLNCQSSRSHQIVKLTIESRSHENSTHAESFVASLNLVDLAGSEFAEQAETRGVRQIERGQQKPFGFKVSDKSTQCWRSCKIPRFKSYTIVETFSRGEFTICYYMYHKSCLESFGTITKHTLIRE